jgi:hypothetical protein
MDSVRSISAMQDIPEIEDENALRKDQEEAMQELIDEISQSP